jgi:hypothetical protein
MTPYELSIYANLYNERKMQEDKDRITQAYLVAAWTSRWVWEKKIPTLEKVLPKEKELKVNKPERMTSEKMLERIKEINAQLGGTVY